jgi:chromosome segregation ATPase
VSGRIIDADVDAIANIARLTGQVGQAITERDLARKQRDEALADVATLTRWNNDKNHMLAKSDAQRDELQRMLTVCEEEKESLRIKHAELFYDCEIAEDRVRVLEAELRNIQKWAETCLSIGATNTDLRRVIGRCDDAIHMTATPPAETLAHWRVFIPTADRERMGAELYERIAGHVSRLESENDRLRADLATAKEEIVRLRDYLVASEKREVEAHRKAEATKAQLARVMAILPDALLWVEAESIKLSDAMPYEACIDEIKAILADADSKVKP